MITILYLIPLRLNNTLYFEIKEKTVHKNDLLIIHFLIKMSNLVFEIVCYLILTKET